MALIVSPNLTVDRTVRIERLQPGAVLRPERAVVTAGSKGVNVARVLAALGRPARLVGFLPDVDRPLIERLFDREPLELIGVEVAGELRVATIYLEHDGRVTVLNEPGPDIDAAGWGRLEDTVQEALNRQGASLLACSGSLPPGAPVDAYGRLVSLAHRAGTAVTVDAARQVLAATLPHGPDLVAPNLAEAEEALGWSQGEAVDERGPDVPARAARAAGALVRAGARAAVVTAGASGAVCATPHAATYFPGVPIEVVNPIGAGDSFVAGHAAASERGEDLLTAVASGLGAATASCEHPLAGGIDPGRARELTGQIAAGRRPIDAEVAR